jgi:hypothetical protein
LDLMQDALCFLCLWYGAGASHVLYAALVSLSPVRSKSSLFSDLVLPLAFSPTFIRF